MYPKYTKFFKAHGSSNIYLVSFSYNVFEHEPLNNVLLQLDSYFGWYVPTILSPVRIYLIAVACY